MTHPIHPIIDADCRRMAERLGDRLERLSGRTILLTGGSGFLGSYFVQSLLVFNETRLKHQPARLICLDSFLRGVPDWLSELRDSAKLLVVKADVRQPLPEGLPGFEYVIHAASLASPSVYRKYPIDTMDVNVGGVRRLLDHAVRVGGVGSFLFMSSSEIYGDPPPAWIPISEEYLGNVSCTGPRSCYGESKRYGETLCANFHRVHNVPVKTARPFNNYGPGLSLTDRRVLSDFCANVLHGEDIVLFSDGSPTRTFCYAADAVYGYWLLLLSDHEGEAFNIGGESPEISMIELAELVLRVAEKELNITGPRVIRKISGDPEYLTDSPNRRCPSIAKARKLLGYDPEVPLEEGLRRSLRWYADQVR